MKVPYILFLFLISIFVCRNYLFENGYPSGMDSLGFFSSISYFSIGNRFLDIWSDVSSGTGTAIPRVTSLLLAFFNYFVNDTGFTLKIYFFSYIFLSGMFMFFFANNLFGNRLSSFISAIIYMFNKMAITINTSGHIDHMLAYMLLPLIFLYLKKYIDRGNFIDILKFSLLFSMVAITRFDPLLYVSLGIAIFALLNVLFFNKKIIFERVVNISVVSILLFIPLTMYIWLPFSVVGTDMATITRTLDIASDYSLDIFNTILGYRTADGSGYIFWVGKESIYDHILLSNITAKILMLIIPILSFISFLALNKKNRYVTIFISIAIISLFLAKGPRQPFGEFYIILYNTLPLFDKITEPNRWLISTWFSYAILVGFLIDFVTNKLKLIIFSLVVIYLILATPYIFINGYQISDIYATEKDGYTWLKDYNSLYGNTGRVVTLPYAQDRMFIPQGWIEPDIGKQSYAFHDMPVFNFDYDLNTHGSEFYKYSQKLILDSKIDDVVKMLGIFDVKYLISQDYPMTQPLHPIFPIEWRWTYKSQQLFDKNDNLHEIYSGTRVNYTIKAGVSWANLVAKQGENPKLYNVDANSTLKIYENVNHMPRIFAPNGQMVVVGGLESFPKLAEIKNFKFSEWNLLFSNDLVDNIGGLLKQVSRSDYVVFVNTEQFDLAMMLTNKTRIKVSNFEKDSIGWNVDNTIINDGFFIYGKDVISSGMKGGNVVYIADIDNSSTYEIWIRVLYDGDLNVYIDKELIGSERSYFSQKFGFKWIKIGDIDLKRGSHKVEIFNENGENKINEVVMTKKGEVNSTLNLVKNLVYNKSIYLIDTEKSGEFRDVKKNVILYRDGKPIGDIYIRSKMNNSVKRVEFNNVVPSKWIVKVNSTTPYILVFSNSYHSMWRAYVDGKEYESVPSYYLINSFQINETGEHEVIIEFIGQRVQNIAMIISGLTYAICIGYIFYDLRRRIDIGKNGT